MNRGVFLDRDGVLNELVFNPTTGEYESPHNPEDLVLIANVVHCLDLLQKAGFKLFIVSNQPDYAKGKAALDNLYKIEQKFEMLMFKHKILFSEYFYCHHYPGGSVRGYSRECECRKPGTFFLEYARDIFGLDLQNSWMVGDRDKDILCGQRVGVKTILIEEPKSAFNRGKCIPDYIVEDFRMATDLILEETVNEG